MSRQRPGRDRQPREGLLSRIRRLCFRVAAVGLGVFGALPLLLVLLGGLLPVQVTPLMLLRLLEGEGMRQDWVPLERVSPYLLPAILAGEDNGFCQHEGIDWAALQTAVKEVESGRRDELRGASTVSMQLTKNLLLWPDRDRLRKGLELTYVTWIEALWSKRRMLEVYVNVVEWGPGIYGAEAAAQHHFGVSAEALTARQAALLAAVLPNPIERNAGRPSGFVQERAATLERRARDIAPLLDCF